MLTQLMRPLLGSILMLGFLATGLWVGATIGESSGAQAHEINGNHWASSPVGYNDITDNYSGNVISRKNNFLQQYKDDILVLARDKTKLASYPTKATPGTGVTILKVIVPPSRAEQITIDELSNFSRVAGRSPSRETLPIALSEEDFKNGIQRILGEPGKFKDWGGENSDLTSTRLVVAGRRRPVAFAFKGPGLNAKLTPGRMGTNGDQIQRLFYTGARVFLVQHWREIADSVPEQLRTFAAMRSNMTAERVWYGIIDGADSRRIYDAYPEAFSES